MAADALAEECKTDQSHRTIHLPSDAIEALQRHRDRQGAERLAAGDGYRDHGLIFADPSGEPLRADGVYKYHWLPMLKRLKLPRITIHGARHSYATMLLEEGVPMKVVQEALGHSSISVTADIYSHVTPLLRKQAAGALAAHLAKTRSNTESGEGQIT